MRQSVRRLTHRYPVRHIRLWRIGSRRFTPFRSRLRQYRLRRNFVRKIGIRRKNLRTKSGLLGKLRRSRFVSRLGKYGKQLFKTRPLSKMKGYLKKMRAKIRKNVRVKNFVKSLKSKFKSLRKKSKSFVTRFVKGLLKKSKFGNHSFFTILLLR